MSPTISSRRSTYSIWVTTTIRLWEQAFDYLEYLGTSDMTPEELKSEFYRLACTFYVSPGNERTYVVLSGLNENMPAAMQLFEKLLADAQVNKESFTTIWSEILKARADAKLNQGQNFSPPDELCDVRPEVSCHQFTDGSREPPA